MSARAAVTPRRPRRIFTRIVIPTAIALALLPPLACLVFHACAQQYAYDAAAQELDALQTQISPLLDGCFPDDAGDAPARTDGQKPGARGANRGTPENGADAVSSFLEAAGVTASQMGGNARLMILASEMQVVYPRNDQLRQAAQPLADDFAAFIQSDDSLQVAQGETAELKGSDGETYLANISEVPAQSQRIRYVITYCPTSRIDDWVVKATVLVLGVASVFAALAFCALWFATRSITRPLRRLCREAERIGSGNFDAIEPAFNLRELEELRKAMNGMSVQLDRAEQTQRRFFQNVSHELRSPLMSIGGYAQGIEQGLFQPPAKAARVIMDESKRLEQAVNGLIELSRLEGARPERPLTQLSIADATAASLARAKGVAGMKGLRLSADMDKDLTALGDAGLLASVLDNLIGNAIRYGRTFVTVSAREEGAVVAISVADDGNGIAADDLPHIFERCYKGAGGQFGIGLAIARAAAEQMHGTLQAENRPESGAVLTLRLQKAPNAQDASEAQG